MLQGRLLSYPDAHCYRLGANYEQVPANKCPFAVNKYQRAGYRRVNGNSGSNPNCFPNSFDDIHEDEAYDEKGLELENTMADCYDRNAKGEKDHFTHSELLYRKVMSDQHRKKTVSNIVGTMSSIDEPKKD